MGWNQFLATGRTVRIVAQLLMALVVCAAGSSAFSQDTTPPPQEPTRDAETERLINEVRAGMEANLAKIHTLTGVLDENERLYVRGVQEPGGPKWADRKIHREFWIDGDRSRVKFTVGIPDVAEDGTVHVHDSTEEYINDGKRLYHCEISRELVTVENKSTPGSNMLPEKDLSYGYHMGYANWEGILRREIDSAKRLDDGRILMHRDDVQGTYHYLYEIIVDPAHGYLIVEATGRTEAGSVIFRRFDAAFLESGGAWFLSRVKDEYYDLDDPSKITTKRHLNVVSLECNGQIPASTFTYTPPPGVTLYDKDTKKQSRTDPIVLEQSKEAAPRTWLFTGGIAAAVAVLILIVFLVFKRRRG